MTFGIVHLSTISKELMHFQHPLAPSSDVLRQRVLCNKASSRGRLIGQNRFCAISCNCTQQFCAISCYSTKRVLCMKASLNQTVVCLSVALVGFCSYTFHCLLVSFCFLIIVGSGSCVGLCVGGFQLQRCCFVILVIGRG